MRADEITGADENQRLHQKYPQHYLLAKANSIDSNLESGKANWVSSHTNDPL